jgi:hypothetical protein
VTDFRQLLRIQRLRGKDAFDLAGAPTSRLYADWRERVHRSAGSTVQRRCLQRSGSADVAAIVFNLEFSPARP